MNGAMTESGPAQSAAYREPPHELAHWPRRSSYWARRGVGPVVLIGVAIVGMACPACGQRVTPGDLVAWSEMRVLHAACRARRDALADGARG